MAPGKQELATVLRLLRIRIGDQHDTAASGRITPWLRVAERRLSANSFHAVLLHGV